MRELGWMWRSAAVLLCLLLGVPLTVAAGAAPARAAVGERVLGVPEAPPNPLACRWRDPQIQEQQIPVDRQAAADWARARMRFQDAWMFSRGAGVTVAVVDSGVDGANASLAGRLLPGLDVTGAKVVRGGMTDCFSHGTAVAGIIAGRPARGQDIHGAAPDSRILPIRESWGIDSFGNGLPGSADHLIFALKLAIESGARVVNVSVTTDGALLTARQRRAFESLARKASRLNVLVVAAAGNHTDYRNARNTNPVTYPAALARTNDSVIAVGGVTAEGTTAPDSITGDFISVAAPDLNVPCLLDHGGVVLCEGNSFAAPFVSGLAALVISRYPKITLSDLKRRILLTADQPASSIPDPGVGYGVINPMAALTAAVPAPAPAPTGQPEPVLIAPAPSRGQGGLAAGLAAGAVTLAGLLVGGALTLRRGRRRNWRPGVPA